MAIVVIVDGKVRETYRDVENVEAAFAKYPHLADAYIVDGDWPVDTAFANGDFTLPEVPPEVVDPEPILITAIRELAEAVGPGALTAFNARMGSGSGGQGQGAGS